MHSIYVDSRFDDEKRRQHLYDGQLFVYSPRPSSLAFTNFALQMIKDAFGKDDPTTAQYDMPVEEFRSLNPAYSRPVIIRANTRQILLPIDKVDEFHANLEQNGEPLVTWQTYALKKGETLESVAQKFNIGMDRLQEVNGLSGRKRVQPGQMLLVPLEGEDAETNLDETFNLSDFKASPEESASSVRYRVRPGDTLSTIARKHH